MALFPRPELLPKRLDAEQKTAARQNCGRSLGNPRQDWLIWEQKRAVRRLPRSLSMNQFCQFLLE
jgi:hypothetical protein